MTLTSELLAAHSPGNRFVYYPATKSWNNEKLPTFGELVKDCDHGHVYLHIPYCHSLCTFCGCNIKIDQNEQEHLSYIDAIIKELELKDPAGHGRSLIKTLTLGGGSPNALHPKALEKLIRFLSGYFTELGEVLIEVEPIHLTANQVSQFRELSRNPHDLRFSMGVQDFSSTVCQNFNRHQNPEDIFRAFEIIGPDHEKSIDLIWGLPLQEIDLLEQWPTLLEKLRPSSISYYPLALVPWQAPYQEAYGSFKVPSLEKKYQLFEIGHNIFEKLNFNHFGFGHYLATNSSLDTACKKGEFYRSVSGLYRTPHDFSLGLGVGSISQYPTHYHQNERVLEKYKYQTLEKRNVLGHQSHSLSSKEKTFIQSIENIVYASKMPFNPENHPNISQQWVTKREDAEEWKITPKGRLFLKNIIQTLEKEKFSHT